MSRSVAQIVVRALIEPVRSRADAVALAERDERVRVVREYARAAAEEVVAGTSMLAAEVLVWLYRYGYRLGWDSVVALVVLEERRTLDTIYQHGVERPQRLAEKCIADGHAWPDPDLERLRRERR